MITINGKEFRNLVEQVAKNQEDIKKHYEIEQTLADWGIKVIGRQDTWEPPTGSFAFGDAIAVGPEGGPFDFYIWTRRSDLDDEGYWFNYGPISIVGPQGPQGEPGPKGDTGSSSKWFVGPNEPTGDIHDNDMWLRVNSDGTTSGFVYQYKAGVWALFTTILGPQGIQGPEGKQGKQGPMGPQGPQGPRGYTTITNIIAELPEGTVISDIYNPSTQPDNATILMPVGGVQHAWVIINGMWTDAGPYSGGSTVYVNGEAVNTFDADTKLDKKTNPTTTQQVYCKTASGGQFMANFTESPTANAVPKYGAGGVLSTNNPTSALHCANKQYVDNAIARAHGELQHTVLEWFKGQPLQFQVDLGVYINPSMPSLPSNFQLYGLGGYVLNSGNYYSNGAAINELTFSMTDFKAKLTSYYTGGSTGTTLGQFQINDYTINGTVATFIMTADDFGPEGGIFTFDCIPHSPNA